QIARNPAYSIPRTFPIRIISMPSPPSPGLSAEFARPGNGRWRRRTTSATGLVNAARMDIVGRAGRAFEKAGRALETAVSGAVARRTIGETTPHRTSWTFVKATSRRLKELVAFPYARTSDARTALKSAIFQVM